MPARAPPSIGMLQTAMPPSSESARIASAAHSGPSPAPPPPAPSPRVAAVRPWQAAPGRRRARVLRLRLDRRLGGEPVRARGGAAAVRERAERPMGRGVAVAAHDGGAGQCETLLGSDHVHDALTAIMLVEIFDAELARV